MVICSYSFLINLIFSFSIGYNIDQSVYSFYSILSFNLHLYGLEFADQDKAYKRFQCHKQSLAFLDLTFKVISSKNFLKNHNF